MSLILLWWLGTVSPLLPWYSLLASTHSQAMLGATLAVMVCWPITLPSIVLMLVTRHRS